RAASLSCILDLMPAYDFPFVDPSHLSLADRVAQLNVSRVRTLAAQDDEDKAARELVRLLAAEGLLNYAAADESESAKLDVRSICVVREQLSYESSLADLMFAMQGLGSFPIAIAGSPELKRELLPKVRAGLAIAAFAMTEPEAGSDAGSIRTTARAEGDHFFIDGVKTFISNAGLADFYTVFASTDPELGGTPR